MRASVLIPAFNEGELLWKTIASCDETCPDLDCEFIVADNGSTDGSVDEAKRRYPEITVVGDTNRRGPSPAKHLAATHARGDVLVFLDGHCRVTPDALERLVADVEEWGGQAIVTPRVVKLDPDSWALYSCHAGCCQRLDLATLDPPQFTRTRYFAARGRFRETAGLIGCSFAMSRELYERLWGCDADMRHWGSDDADLGLKAWLMGHAVLNDPEIVVGHRFRASTSAEAERHPEIWANRLRMARKNFSDPTWDDWLSRFRERIGESLFETSWDCFERRRPSVEREREYLLGNRAWSEFDFAEHFRLDWPRRESVH